MTPAPPPDRRSGPPPDYPAPPPRYSPPPLPPPPGLSPPERRRRWLPPPAHHVTMPMRVVGVAQFLTVGLLALAILFALFILAVAAFTGPLFLIVFESIIAPVLLALLLIPLHLVIATGIFEMRRWGIVLLAAASTGYAVACLAAIITGRDGTEDALRSRVVLSLILWAVLALLNALACSQWRHAR